MKNLSQHINEQFSDDADRIAESSINEDFKKVQLTSKTTEGKVTGWLEISMGEDSLGDATLDIESLKGNSSKLKKAEVEKLIDVLQKALKSF